MVESVQMRANALDQVIKIFEASGNMTLSAENFVKWADIFYQYTDSGTVPETPKKKDPE